MSVLLYVHDVHEYAPGVAVSIDGRDGVVVETYPLYRAMLVLWRTKKSSASSSEPAELLFDLV